ncbi:MAG: anthranilate phosphoribosyltransferase [Bryobacterales bacterium]|nr:anthranilate phosphoribosyltransferase [Bryobacterales bacterium]
MSLLPFLEIVVSKHSLDAGQARDAMLSILEGTASTPQIAAFLVALRMKGEVAAEVVGFARAMREMAAPVYAGEDARPLVDTCGTGGDGAGTFNISTVAAFVVAGAGGRVAKHGNRSISSRCGSADVMEGLGVNVSLPPERVARSIRETGIGFLFAPAIHTATRHAQLARLELKMRTVFNLLGPLTNPAGAGAQLVGAPSPEAAALIADALAALGLTRGFVVHGRDGLDEITTTGPTLAFEIRDGGAVARELTPEDFGVVRAGSADLRGGDRETNAEIVRAILRGERGPRRDIVLVNAAAALVAAGLAGDFREGVARAAEAIDSGAALGKLEALIRFAALDASHTEGGAVEAGPRPEP